MERRSPNQRNPNNDNPPNRSSALQSAFLRLHHRDDLRACFIEVNRLENEGDRIVREATAGLFDGDMKCTDIIKWKDIYATLEGAIDQCEDVANVIETIVLKNT